MTLHTIFRTRYTGAMLLSVLIALTSALTSCSDDDNDPSGSTYFTIDGNTTTLAVENTGATKNYTVRSNRPWKIVAQEDNAWSTVFPAEGKDDGIFKLTVGENKTFENRVMNFAFMVDGEEQPVLFRIEQKASVPNITITGSDKGITVLSAGGSVSIAIKANVNWTYTLDDNSWLTEQSVSTKEVKLLASKNPATARTATLTVKSAEYPALDQKVIITQLAGGIVLQESFSWLPYGSTVPYTTGGEISIDKWTAEEKAHGWTGTGATPFTYGRPGFIKLGKTGAGGDIISPKMSIEGIVNLKVTFKAAVYISAAGAIDDRIVKVFALGAGTPSVAQFSIDNIPNNDTQDKAGIVNNIWADDRAYSFTITGATADTQIKFLGGDYDLTGVGQGKNRIFMDDIKVEIVE